MYNRKVVLFAFAIICICAFCAYAKAAPQQNTDAKTFLKSIIGEWVGKCEQSTDGIKADDKYFHAVVKQVNSNTFHTKFEYYRYGKNNNSPLRIGESTVTTVIEKDGRAQSKMTGSGVVLVNNKPKKQTNQLTEKLTAADAYTLNGEGCGKICVLGMPFGLGKNGTINTAKSIWTIKNGELSIEQSIIAGFRASIFSKTFSVTAHYVAKHGKDIAHFMNKDKQASAKM